MNIKARSVETHVVRHVAFVDISDDPIVFLAHRSNGAKKKITELAFMLTIDLTKSDTPAFSNVTLTSTNVVNIKKDGTDGAHHRERYGLPYGFTYGVQAGDPVALASKARIDAIAGEVARKFAEMHELYAV